MKEIINKIKAEPLTHGIVHAGFSGLRRFVARKKGRLQLDSLSLRNPARHHTINVVSNPPYTKPLTSPANESG